MKRQHQKFLILFTFFSFYFLSINEASSQVAVDNMFQQFSYSESPVKNVTVLNTDGVNSISVEVESYKVLDPGTDHEKLVTEDALIVTPKKFSIDKSGQRTVRLLLRKKAENLQEIYRVNFVPKAESAVDEAENEENKKKKTKAFKLSLMTGAGILVFSNPANPHPEISWETNAQNLILKNTGNQSALLETYVNCEENEKSCVNNPVSKRIYAGREFILPKPAKPFTKVYLNLFSETKELILNGASGKSDW